MKFNISSNTAAEIRFCGRKIGMDISIKEALDIMKGGEISDSLKREILTRRELPTVKFFDDAAGMSAESFGMKPKEMKDYLDHMNPNNYVIGLHELDEYMKLDNYRVTIIDVDDGIKMIDGIAVEKYGKLPSSFDFISEKFSGMTEKLKVTYSTKDGVTTMVVEMLLNGVWKHVTEV